MRLVRERRELEARVREWEEKVQQAMTLKFGRVVDLDSLGAVTANCAVDDLRVKLRNQEEEQARELAVLQVRVSGYLLQWSILWYDPSRLEWRGSNAS